MPAEPLLPESDIRSLVRRVLDGVLDGGDTSEAPATAAPVPPPAPAPAPDRNGGAGGGDTIAVGADHGGFQLKESLAAKLRDAGFEVDDCGTHGTDAVDYPEFAHAVARRVADGSARWGLVVDGAGIGSAMVANKVPGVRAALCYDISSARNSREHNHANVLTLGAGLIGPNLAWQIVEAWLAMPWGGDRHARRVAMITELENRYAASGAAQR